MKKKLLSMLLLATCVLCLIACGKEKEDVNSTSGKLTSADKEGAKIELPIPDEGLLTRENSGHLSGKYNIEIEIEEYGTIALTLDADVAPVTVTNFIDLVQDGFYNGLTFHRIIDGFMIQGGDPEGTGMGGSENNIVGEFAQNGYENNISF